MVGDNPNQMDLSGKSSGATRRQLIIRSFQWMAGMGLGYIGWCYVQGAGSVSRIVRFTRKPHAGEVIFRQGVFLVGSSQGVLALSARCPHLGCRLTYQAVARRFQCPCHGSQFSITGTRLQGPAVKNMYSLNPEAVDKGNAFKVTLPAL